MLAACGDGGTDTSTADEETTESGEAAGSADDGHDVEPLTITLGLSPFQDTLLPIVGTEFGWFEEAGLTLDLVSLEWGAIVPAVASGQVDIAVNNTTGVVSAAHRQPELIYWYGWNPFTEGAALMGDPDSGLRSVDDFVAEGMSEEEARDEAILQLEGREIVTTMGTDMGKNVLAALDSVGLSQDDVEIRDLDPDSGLAAFLSGTGDAYLGGIPQRTRATAEGYTVIASGPQLSAPPINGIVTTTSYAEEHEEQLLAFLDVIFRIVDHCNANTSECGEIITTELNSQTGADMSVEDFEEFWQGWENFAASPQEVEEWILDEDGFAYWRATWDTDNEFLYEETGDIPAPADPDEHFWGERVHERYLETYGS
jgi:NitT/TauT family transport system substrate-binding protein